MFSTIEIRWESLSVLVAAALVYIFFRKDMKENGYIAMIAEEMFLGMVIWSVLGARFSWYLTNGFRNILHFFLFFDDGFELLGGVISIIVFVFIYIRLNYMSFRRTLDCILPHLLLALGIGYLPFGLKDSRIFLVSGVAILGYLLLEILGKRLFHDRHRGDRASLALLWLGLSWFFINVALYGRSNIHPVSGWTGVGISVVALIFYICNRIFPIHRKPLVLFDFDGTLMDTKAMVDESYRYLFDKYGNLDDFDDQTKLEVFGAEDKEAIAQLFSNQNTTELTTEFRSFQENLPALGLVNLMPHALEILMWLKKHGYVVGVVTTRPTDNCRMWLEEFDIEEYVDMVMGAEVYKNKKPAPDALRRICHELKMGHDYCVYIGDHARDVRMARRACVYAIGYATSKQVYARLEKAQPNEIIDDLLQLRDSLKKDNHNWTYNQL